MGQFIKKKFKDFIKLQRGFDLPKIDRRKGKIPVVASTSITDFHNEFKVKAPGVTTGRSGSLGEVLYIDEDFWPLNTTLWVRDFKGNDPRFVYYFLQTMHLEQFNSGAGVPTLNRNHLDTIEISIPVLKDQKVIASILGSFDDLIEVNLGRIEVLEEVARCLYEEWFIHLRYPGHENTENTQTPNGTTPKEWKLKTVSESIEIDPSYKVTKNTEKKYVPMGNLSTHSMIIEGYEIRKGSSGSKFQNGDILFARITPSLENGKTGYVQFLDEGETAIGSTEFIVLKSKTLTPEFVYLMARNERFRQNAIKSMVGASGRQRVQKECFDNFYFPHPPESLLTRFTEIVYPIFKQIHILSKQNKNLKQTRDLLLPKLISGEIDISNIETQL